MARFVENACDNFKNGQDSSSVVNSLAANGRGATNLFERHGAGLSAIDHVRDISLHGVFNKIYLIS